MQLRSCNWNNVDLWFSSKNSLHEVLNCVLQPQPSSSRSVLCAVTVLLPVRCGHRIIPTVYCRSSVAEICMENGYFNSERACIRGNGHNYKTYNVDHFSVIYRFRPCLDTGLVKYRRIFVLKNLFRSYIRRKHC